MSESVTYQTVESSRELAHANQVWHEVFVVEKGETPSEKAWGSEPGAQVFLAIVEDACVGAAQLTPVEPGLVQIEHVAVLLSHRRRRIGEGIIQAMIGNASSQNLEQIQLSARADAEGFYQKLGFERIGEAYEDFGSPHILMGRHLQ